MTKRRNYEELGEYTMPPDLVDKVERMTAEADAEIEATRVTFRWGKEQLDVVKRAAQLMGVPYQTFIKLVVYQQSLNVLKGAEVLKRPSDAS